MLVCPCRHFGRRSAPEVAYGFSMAVLLRIKVTIHCMGVKGWALISVVCNDWLVLLHAECHAVWMFIMEAMEALGLTVNRLPHNCILQRRDLPWLGLWFNSQESAGARPNDKMAKAVAVIASVQRAHKVGRRVLDSLVGHLSFLSMVACGGRAFLHGVHRLRFLPDCVA